MPRAKKKPKGHGIHHFDNAAFSLQLYKEHRGGGSGVVVMLKESDDEDDLSAMATHLYPWLPNDCTLKLIDERDCNHYTQVIGVWHGQQPKSPERHYWYEWVEDEE